MSNVFSNIKKWVVKNFAFVFLVIFGVVKFADRFIRESESIDNVSSPVPFMKDKHDPGVIKVINKDSVATVSLPEGITSNKIKAVQINSEKLKVEVEIKHEKINVDNNIDDLNPSDFEF